MIKANGRVALILFAGFFLAIGSTARAAPAASTKADSAAKPADAVKTSKHRRHVAKRHSAKDSSKTAQKSSDDKANRPATAENDTPVSSAMPPAVANANAQVAAADTPAAAAASAMTDRANDNVQAAPANTAGANTSGAPAADSQVVASDQLNDVDRAVQQDSPPAQLAVVAAADAQPRPAPVLAASHAESSAWDQSTLIGKIFIGFGALLTLASAARMFMA